MNFGLSRIKQEGTPAHPEDVYIHCGCVKCEEQWNKQLEAYEKNHNTLFECKSFQEITSDRDPFTTEERDEIMRKFRESQTHLQKQTEDLLLEIMRKK